MLKKVIVVSAINFFEGGPLSILKDLLKFASGDLIKDYRVIALVHDKNLVKDISGVEFIEYKDSRDSWGKRVYYEYFFFKKLSQELNPFLWLSLHDMTPNVKAERRAVYCHNPTPFYQSRISELFTSPKVFLFNKFYKYLYQINIKKNSWVVVQQNWMREAFRKMYNIDNIIVAYPTIDLNAFSGIIEKNSPSNSTSDKFCFFYPSFPRVFKNFEIVCQAAQKLVDKGITNFEVELTIDGTENKYAQQIVAKYNSYKNIKFIGLLPRKEVFETYLRSDCLIFPSRLETWGLPITEFKLTGKPMLVADLPYAKETVGEYAQVKFFDPYDANMLATSMENILAKKTSFDATKAKDIIAPFSNNWEELFKLLLAPA